MRLALVLMCVSLGFYSEESRASVFFENNLFFQTNSFSADTDTSVTNLYGSLFIGATIPKVFFMGWDFTYVSRSLNTGSGTVSLSGTEIGPKFGLWIGKAKVVQLAVAWHPLIGMSHTPSGGTAASLSGWGIVAEFGVAPKIGKKVSLGIKFAYHLANYSTSTASGTETNVSYSFSTILPMVYLSWRFGKN